MFQKLLVYITIIINTVYLIWRTFYTLPLSYGILAIVLAITLLIAELSAFFELVVNFFLLRDNSNVITPKVEENADWPSVDVFVACYNEPLDLVLKTVNAATFLKYPNKEKVRVFICDDKRRDDLKNLANRLEVGYITRADNKHAKAGNLNNALKFTDGDLLVTLDADMIVRDDFLLKTVPFFLTDEKMAFVQVPHQFYNPDTFQYNMFSEGTIPNEQDFFHTSIQNGRSKYNAVIYAGSNTVISRQILNETGGFETGTITEDIATGMKFQAKGYHSTFVNETLAIGLSPFNINDLFTQRIRWALGAIQTLRKRSGHFSALNFKQKVIYTMSYSYWFNSYRRLTYLIAPVIFILFKIPIVISSPIEVLIFWAPMFVINHLTYKRLSNGIRSSLLNNLYETVFAPSLAYNLFKEIVGFKQSIFKVTPKDAKKVYGNFNLYLFIPHLFIFVMLIVGLFNGTYLFLESNFAFVFGINIFWIIYNSYVLILSLLYASERPIFRTSTRFNLKLEVRAKFHNTFENYQSINVSDNGLSLKSDHRLHIQFNKEYDVKIHEHDLDTHFKVKLVRVIQNKKIYYYGFEISKISKKNAQTYFQIIYSALLIKTQNEEKKYGKLSILHVLLSKRKSNQKPDKIKFNKPFEFSFDKEKWICDIDHIDYDLVYIQAKFDLAPIHMQLSFDEGDIHFDLISKEKDNLYVYQIAKKDIPRLTQLIELHQDDIQISKESIM